MSVLPFRSLSEIQSEPVRWLWEGRIPRGKVTLLEGDPGVGKSMLALDLAARVSRGASMPSSKKGPSESDDVLIFSGDDNLADTVRPRLEAAGAELDRIHPFDRELTKDEILAHHPALIILDPLSAYTCLVCNRPVREVVQGLARLADETEAAILVLQTMPENTESEWSREIFSAARSVLTITTLGHDGRRLALAKSNLQPLGDVPPLAYRLDDPDGNVRIVGWSDGR